LQVFELRVGLAAFEHPEHGVPVGGAEGDGERGIEASHAIARRLRVESRAGVAACVGELGGERGGCVELPLFHQVRNGVHQVVHVVPVVFDRDVLLALVLLLDGGGLGEPVLGGGVVADTVIDVAGHVDHVPGGGRETGEDGGAVERLFGMRAGFDSVDPVVVGGGVVGACCEDFLDECDLLLLAFLGLAVVVVAVAQRAGQEELCL
jgi:hypothetical protein